MELMVSKYGKPKYFPDVWIQLIRSWRELFARFLCADAELQFYPFCVKKIKLVLFHKPITEYLGTT